MNPGKAMEERVLKSCRMPRHRLADALYRPSERSWAMTDLFLRFALRRASIKDQSRSAASPSPNSTAENLSHTGQAGWEAWSCS